MTELQYPPVILGLIEVHFEELDFLWEQRQGILFAPDWNVAELAELEARAEAHLDGLRLAAGHAVDIARPALMGSEVFAATAATLVYLGAGVPELQQEALEAMSSGSPEARDGIRLGLRHARINGLRAELESLAADDDPSLAAAAADVLVFHGFPAPNVERLLAAPEASDRVLALGTLGRQGTMTDRAALEGALADESSAVRLASLRSAAMSGMNDLDDFCRTLSATGDSSHLEALTFLGVLGDVASYERLEAAARDADSIQAAIPGLGALGQTRAIPRLIEIMDEDEENARAAAEAFLRITGYEDIWVDGPVPEPQDELNALDSGDDEDEAVLEDQTSVDAEFVEDLPAPCPNKTREWWNAHAQQFSEEGVWQSGLEVSEAVGSAAFDALSLETRRDLLLASRSKNPSCPEEIELEAMQR